MCLTNMPRMFNSSFEFSFFEIQNKTTQHPSSILQEGRQILQEGSGQREVGMPKTGRFRTEPAGLYQTGRFRPKPAGFRHAHHNNQKADFCLWFRGFGGELRVFSLQKHPLQAIRGPSHSHLSHTTDLECLWVFVSLFVSLESVEFSLK